MVNTKLETTGLKPTDLAWIAGYVDGEGCVVMRSGSTPQLMITNTHLPTLQFIQEKLGGTIRQISSHTNLKHRLCYRLDITNQTDCPPVLRLLAPYLREKAGQALLVRMMCHLKKADRTPYLTLLADIKQVEHTL